MRVAVSSSPEVERVLAGLGRTEDVTFSPCGRRLAIAGYGHNTVLVLDSPSRRHSPARAWR